MTSCIHTSADDHAHSFFFENSTPTEITAQIKQIAPLLVPARKHILDILRQGKKLVLSLISIGIGQDGFHLNVKIELYHGIPMKHKSEEPGAIIHQDGSCVAGSRLTLLCSCARTQPEEIPDMHVQVSGL